MSSVCVVHKLYQSNTLFISFNYIPTIMSSIIVNNNQLIIYANDKIFSYNTTNKISTEIKIPSLEIPSNLTKNQQDALKSEKPSILSSSFSKCGKYFAICTLNKQLIVYNTPNFDPIRNVTIARAVSKIRFTTSCDIVIADKTGDVYLYRLNNDKPEPNQLLGHLSMLLDVIVSDDEKYIITCDRDEKIRVSQFPGSYNIESFCLGHEEFVLNLEFCTDNVLVSSSGDGTLRFWDFIAGNQIQVINTNEFIKDKSIIRKFSEFMDGETVDVNYLPITCMKLFNFEEVTSKRTVIVVSLFNFNGLLVFEVQCSGQKVSYNLLQIIDNLNVVSFDLSEKLYVLTDNNLSVYHFINGEFILKTSLIEFFESCKDALKIEQNLDNISVLYKRKYDNVQEYQERKKLRIEGKK